VVHTLMSGPDLELDELVQIRTVGWKVDGLLASNSHGT
jgi:hypothetical protein